MKTDFKIAKEGEVFKILTLCVGARIVWKPKPKQKGGEFKKLEPHAEAYYDWVPTQFPVMKESAPYFASEEAIYSDDIGFEVIDSFATREEAEALIEKINESCN